ncbi:hypothetical protein CcaverHIS002_0309660 [Cutaneotrichosporon cavernicola]|nr:hypothetical protein CcaverHIS002_0309660 [Cutaneotrichosporon cavernicola]
MLFTLRLVSISVADKCTPGGGCTVPSWVRGSPEAKILLWDRMETARLAEINGRWIPLTYACIAYSVLALVYLLIYLYTHVVAPLENIWTWAGCDATLQFLLGGAGIAVATLHLMVHWNYGWFDSDIFSSRACDEFGPYCSRQHSPFPQEIPTQHRLAPSSSNPNRLSASSDMSASDANRLSTGSLGSSGITAPAYHSQPKNPSRLRETVIYSAYDAHMAANPEDFEPVRDPERDPDVPVPDKLCDNHSDTSPAITVTRPNTSSQGHDPLTSSTWLLGTLGHRSTSHASRIRGRSRPTSLVSNYSSRPSSFAVFAALDDLQEVLAAPSLTPDVIQTLQTRIAALHFLARPPAESLPLTPPPSDDSTPSLPALSIHSDSHSALDPSSPRRSLPLRGRHARA